MKLILSRKGFDSGYGGYPSAILPDGRMVSLPIPDKDCPQKYSDLLLNSDFSYADLMIDLFGSKIKHEGRGKVELNDTGCHMDPDIDKHVLDRDINWKGILGQCGSAQSHLDNQNIKIEDIFLFFGWFRKVDYSQGQFSYSPADNPGKHVIFGYLEVGEIIELKKQRPESWMNYHPHVNRKHGSKGNDTLYIASDTLTGNEDVKGYGMFRYSDELVLTKPGMSRSRWNMPPFFRETSISYHSQKSWKENYFQSAAKGQEFVIDGTPQINRWVENLILQSTCR